MTDPDLKLCEEVIAAFSARGAGDSRCVKIARAHHAILSVDLGKEVAEIEARHVKAKADIQNNFGAAYSTRIEQDSYSIHEDRATLLTLLRAAMARQIPKGCIAICSLKHCGETPGGPGAKACEAITCPLRASPGRTIPMTDPDLKLCEEVQ